MMKTELHSVEAMTLEDFAYKHGLVMEVWERTILHSWFDPSAWRYYARFKGSEVSDGNFLKGVSGNGNTPEKAISAYADEISLELLVIDARKDTRREIKVPRILARACEK